MNEPAIGTFWGDPTFPPHATYHDFAGTGGNHLAAHNLSGLQQAQAGYERLRQLAPTKRPFILSRSGWAGLQKYAWTWTGDLVTGWKSLRQTLPTVLNLGLSGIPFSGCDIGGFLGNPSPELYLRWFQLSCFLPFCRTHGSQENSSRREPWYDDLGKPLKPNVYRVGGNTKVYGGALLRLRPQDFTEVEYSTGNSPAWCIDYDTLAPYYIQAEQLYQVHGRRGTDPYEPPDPEDYTFPPLPHSP